MAYDTSLRSWRTQQTVKNGRNKAINQLTLELVQWNEKKAEEGARDSKVSWRVDWESWGKYRQYVEISLVTCQRALESYQSEGCPLKTASSTGEKIELNSAKIGRIDLQNQQPPITNQATQARTINQRITDLKAKRVTLEKRKRKINFGG